MVIDDLSMYLITFIMMAFFFCSALRLLYSIMFMLSERNNCQMMYATFWLLYDCLLLPIVVLSMFVLAGRWHLMETTKGILEKLNEQKFSTSMLTITWVHDHALALASICLAMAIFRLYRWEMNSLSMNYAKWTFHHSGYNIIVVFIYVLMRSYGMLKNMNILLYINIIVNGRQLSDIFVNESFFVQELVFHIMIYCLTIGPLLKLYIVSKMYMPK